MLSPVSTLCLAAANLFVGTPNHESWMDRHESRQRINGILVSPAGFCRDSIVMDPTSENTLPPVIRLIAFNEDTTNPETLVDSDTDRSQSTNQTFTPFKRNSLEGSPSNDAILQGIEAGISRSGNQTPSSLAMIMPKMEAHSGIKNQPHLPAAGLLQPSCTKN